MLADFHFPITTVVFYAFSLLLIASAFMVIFSRHPVQSALYLVLAFFASAGLWIITQAEFLGLILILVYVGAVMTLFLFVVMTVPMQPERFHERTWPYVSLALFVILVFMIIMAKLFMPLNHIVLRMVDSVAPGNGDASVIGSVLYTKYLFPFELAGALLLVAIVAAISLSWKVDRRRKVNDEAAQIAVTAKSRLKIIKDQPSEPSK